jgi:type III pantothenate kinase
MLFALDIGNSNLKIGLYRDGRWEHFWQAQTVPQRMPDEYGVLLRSLFQQAELQPAEVEQAIVSSVVPQLTPGIVNMVLDMTGRQPLTVNTGLDLGISVSVEHPQAIGADLLANAVAGYARFESSCVVVAFGTATTLTAVVEPGELIGVSIAAGLGLTVDALVRGAAQLAHVPLSAPPSVVGRDTEQAMQSGLVLGHVALVEGLLDRMEREIGPVKVVATGGLASVVAGLTDRFDAVDPWLTLEGLRLIADRNQTTTAL